MTFFDPRSLLSLLLDRVSRWLFEVDSLELDLTDDADREVSS